MSMLNAREIHIAVPPLPPAALPLVHGLEDLPGVVYDTLPLPQLAARFRNDEYDCALMPPLAAVDNPLARFVPGIGLVAHRAGTATLYCRTEPGPAARMEVRPGAALFEGPARVLAAGQFGSPLTPCVSGTGGNEAADAVLAAEGAEFAEWPFRRDVFTLWSEYTELPLVVLVWACRMRAPHARLRQVLAAAKQRGLAEWNAPAGNPYRYDLASAAADGLLRLIELARKQGFCRADAGVSFC